MSKRKLLLADDSATIQKVVNLTFVNEGIEVITVSDGDAAMKQFAEAQPDLVMADVNMPGLNGYQVCEAIKQNKATRKIPVILLVGSFEPFDEERARQVGADDFLVKPFQSIRHLVNKVSDLLNASLLSALQDSNVPEIADIAEEKSVNSFDDTLEMNPVIESESVPLIESEAATVIESEAAPIIEPESAPVAEWEATPAAPEDLGDSGMDDEMIQTRQLDSPSSDESAEPETDSDYQPFAGHINLLTLKQPYEYESLTEFEMENDWSKTQPLSEDDFDDFNDFKNLSPDENIAPFEDAKYESADEDERESISDREIDFPAAGDDEQNDRSLRNTEDIYTEQKTFDVLSLSAISALETEESNLLELSPQWKDIISSGESSAIRSENFAASSPPENISSEMIEAIADKVVEKLYDKIIRKIVEEVVSQVANKE